MNVGHGNYENEMDDISEDKIKNTIKECLNNGGFILSDHARQRMKERGYSSRDIIYILRNGTLVETALHKGQPRYTFSGTDLDGHPGEIVVEIRESKGKIIIITVKK